MHQFTQVNTAWGSPSHRTDSPPRRPCHSWSHPQRKSLSRSGSAMLWKWMVCSLFRGWSGLLGLCISILITLSRIPRDPKLHIPQTSKWVQSRCPSVQLCSLSPGQWVNPSALLHSSHAKPSTRPVCCALFVLRPILPMDLPRQRCSRFKQPLRRRLTFGPSEGSACTSRPWVVMTTSVLCQCAHAFLNFCAQLCAWSLFGVRMCFSPVRTTHHGLLVCRVRHCVFDRLKEGCFRSSFAVCLWTLGYLTSQCVSVSNALPWSLEPANPPIMVLS